MTKAQRNVPVVLARLIAFSKEADADTNQILSDRLNEFLDDLKGDDFFGTEAQLDPRGDGRDAEWTMNRIQK